MTLQVLNNWVRTLPVRPKGNVMQQFDGLQITTIVNGPFVENCYLLMDIATNDAVLIDPGDEPERIAVVVEATNAKLVGIWSTHGHIDHVGAVADLQQRFGVAYWFHPDDTRWLDELDQSARMVGIPLKKRPTVNHELSHGDTLTVGKIQAKVLHTPGHSLGGCCFYFPQQKIVFVGDTLFAGSIGRTDFPGGSFKVLIASIRDQLLSLSNDIVVFPGHGPKTDIGTERRTNRYLQ